MKTEQEIRNKIATLEREKRYAEDEEEFDTIIEYLKWVLGE